MPTIIIKVTIAPTSRIDNPLVHSVSFYSEDGLTRNEAEATSFDDFCDAARLTEGFQEIQEMVSNLSERSDADLSIVSIEMVVKY